MRGKKREKVAIKLFRKIDKIPSMSVSKKRGGVFWRP